MREFVQRLHAAGFADARVEGGDDGGGGGGGEYTIIHLVSRSVRRKGGGGGGGGQHVAPRRSIPYAATLTMRSAGSTAGVAVLLLVLRSRRRHAGRKRNRAVNLLLSNK